MLLQSAHLLGWFLPVAAVILLLYLLKMRRREVRVSAVFLFPPVTTDVRANALWQRLRFNALMVLQLLAALLLLVALARPLARGGAPGGKTLVLVLDASASMQATDTAPSRFEAARARLRRWIDGLRAGDAAALIVAAARPQVAVSLGADQARLRAGLAAARSTDEPGDLGEALRLAAALVASRPGGRIVLVSDGAFAEVADFSPGEAEFVYESVGEGGRNAGLVTLDARRRDDGIRLFAALRNFGGAEMKGVLSWFAGGPLLQARELVLPPGGMHGETMALPAGTPEVTIEWESPDDVLSVDDRACWVGGGGDPIRVLIVGPGNLFLERSLALEPGVVVDRAPALPASAREGERGYDVVVFDGVAPQPVGAEGVWLIAAADGDLVRAAGRARQPAIVSWERDDPLLRFVDLGPVLLREAVRVRPADWAQVVARARATPLMVRGERGRQRRLFVGWRLEDSDFPLRVGFPIFVANALRWLAGERRWEQGFSVRAGRAATLPVPADAVEVVGPDGGRSRFQAAGGLLVLSDTDQVGVYQLRAGPLHTRFAVNLLDVGESDIAPRRALDLGGRVYAGRTDPVAWRELWRWAVLLGLALLAAEWMIWVRRS